MATDVTIDRDKYIGGSDLPTILGLNHGYGKTIMQFAREKLNLEEKSFNGNQYTRYGQLLEPKIRNYINTIFGTNFKEDTVIDAVRHYRGNCDGIDREKHLLFEAKTFHGKLKVDYYTPQCQFYMELFDIDECWLVGYNRPVNFYTGVDYSIENGDEYFNTDFDEKNIVIYKIYRDKEYFKKIEVEIEKFKYLLRCLTEEEVMNNATTRGTNSTI